MKIGDIEIKRTAGTRADGGRGGQRLPPDLQGVRRGLYGRRDGERQGMHYSDKKTAKLLGVQDAERPVAVQLFGDEPDILAEAAKKALVTVPTWLTSIMGCPAPKIAGNGGGSALMKNPALAGRIAEAVVKAVPLPVTVKFRKGWDDEHVNAVEFARIMEESGAAALTVHGRTRQQFYSPPVDLDVIAAVKAARFDPRDRKWGLR